MSSVEISGIVISVIETSEQMADALTVRRRVFIDEQGVTEEEEIDGFDGDPAQVDSCIHVLGRLDGAAVATGRLILDQPEGDHPSIGRVAVLAEHRGRHFGEAVMLALHEQARDRDIERVRLEAQLHALPFYERLGYTAMGPVFLDARIEHRRMELRL